MYQPIIKYKPLPEGHDSETEILFKPETNYPQEKTFKIKKVLMVIGILATILTIVSIIAILSSKTGLIDVSSNKSNCAKFTANSPSFP